MQPSIACNRHAESEMDHEMVLRRKVILPTKLLDQGTMSAPNVQQFLRSFVLSLEKHHPINLDQWHTIQFPVKTHLKHRYESLPCQSNLMG